MRIFLWILIVLVLMGTLMAYCVQLVKAPALSEIIRSTDPANGPYIKRGETSRYWFRLFCYDMGYDAPVEYSIDSIDPLVVTFDEPSPIVVPAFTEKTIWFTLTVPLDAPIGEYLGIHHVKVGLGIVYGFTQSYIWRVVGPPAIQITSPESVSYIKNSIPLNFTIDSSTSWIGYSLDNNPNVTITGNTTLAGLTLGSHVITIYATEPILGSEGASNPVHFEVGLPVGGEWVPIDKLELLAPWLSSALLMLGIVTSFVCVRRIKKRKS